MRQFITILISFIFIGLADNVDYFFNNSLGVDAIVVAGSIFTLYLILNAISRIGIYAYRTVRKRESSYLFINFIFSFIVALIVFFARNHIVNIFDITPAQKELFASVLTIFIFYFPINRLSDALFEIVRLKGKLKLYNKSLILFYGGLLFFDFIAFIFTKNLVMLFIATAIASLIVAVYMIFKLKLKFILPNKKDWQSVKRFGVPTLFERIFTSGSAVVYAVIASHLSPQNYAIYFVCFTVAVSLQLITDAYQSTLMIQIPLNKNYHSQKKAIMKLKRKYFLTAIIFNYVLCFVYLFVSHGSLPVEYCLPYILFYSLNIFGLYPYETYKTLCITQGKITIILKSSILGSSAGIALYLYFLNTDFALIGFGFAMLAQFSVRHFVTKIFAK